MTGREGKAVAVLAAASTVVERETDRSLEEMIFDTVTDALAQVGIEPDDLGSVVVSGNDEIDGRVISIMPSSGPAAGVGRDITMIASSGDHALSYAYLRVLAGQGDRVLVVGWAKPSESVSSERAELMCAEPYILREVGMNETIAAALQASRWVEPEDAAAKPLVASPLTQAELPAEADSVYALILAREDVAASEPVLAWIVASGWATSSYELGERDLGVLGSLADAVRQVTERNPKAGPENWSAAEIGAASELTVRRAAEQLRLSREQINPSGSLAEVGTSPYVNGLSRMVAAVRAVAASPGETLVAGIGFHGFASQAATVMVFSSEKVA